MWDKNNFDKSGTMQKYLGHFLLIAES